MENILQQNFEVASGAIASLSITAVMLVALTVEAWLWVWTVLLVIWARKLYDQLTGAASPGRSPRP